MNEPLNTIRLQKYLSSQGACSRRNAEDFMRQGRITIDGKVATLGDKVSGTEDIRIDNDPIKHQEVEKVFLAWNKPIGVEVTLSAARDRTYKTLFDFDFGPHRVFPIGRLDKNSRGLLVLTNDGDLSNQLMHPRYQKEKEYIVTIRKGARQKKTLQEVAENMAKGVVIDGKKTHPCVIEVQDHKTLRFVLKEGRNRQIRKMCEAMGIEVLDLLRIRFGGIELENIPEGRYKEIQKSDLLPKSLEE